MTRDLLDLVVQEQHQQAEIFEVLKQVARTQLSKLNAENAAEKPTIEVLNRIQSALSAPISESVGSPVNILFNELAA